MQNRSFPTQLPPKKGPSWAPVVIMLILFWPVGLILLIRKLASDRSASLGNGGMLLTIGTLLFLGFFAYQGRSSSFLSFFCLIGAIVCLRKGFQMRGQAKRYRVYIRIAVNEGVTRLEEIAARAAQPYDRCVADLRRMLEVGLFHGTLDESAGMLYLLHPGQQQPVYAQPYGQQARQPGPYGQQPSPQQYAYQQVRQVRQVQPQPIAPAVVQCKNCGANNTLEGVVGECEYCGSPLQR